FSAASFCVGALDGFVPAFWRVGSDAADDLSTAKLGTASAGIPDAHRQQTHFFHVCLSKRLGGRNSALAAAIAGSFVQVDQPSLERRAGGFGRLAGLCRVGVPVLVRVNVGLVDSIGAGSGRVAPLASDAPSYSERCWVGRGI